MHARLSLHSKRKDRRCQKSLADVSVVRSAMFQMRNPRCGRLPYARLARRTRDRLLSKDRASQKTSVATIGSNFCQTRLVCLVRARSSATHIRSALDERCEDNEFSWGGYVRVSWTASAPYGAFLMDDESERSHPF